MFNFIRRIFNTASYNSGSIEDIIRRFADGQRSAAGINVDEDVAMRFSTVWACVRLLSDTLAQLPCHLYETDSAGNRKKITDDPIAIAIGQTPDSGLTAFDFWRYQTQCLLLRGYPVSKIIRGGDSVVRLVPVLKVDRVERTPVGKYVFHYHDSADQPQQLQQEDAFFAFYALGDNLLPMSPIAMQANAIGLGIRAQDHGAKTLATNATPSGTLDVAGKLDKQVKKEIKEQWDTTYGPNGTGGIAILEGGAKFAPMSMSNEDAQLLQTRQFQRTEICGIYGVPPHMVSDTTQAKGWSTMEQLMTEFVTLSLNPLAIRFEQAITRALIPRKLWGKRYAKFATNGLLRGDIAARSSLYSTAIASRWMLPNEARAFEDMNPLEGGNEFPPKAATPISPAAPAPSKGTNSNEHP